MTEEVVKKEIVLPPIDDGNLGKYISQYVALRDKISAIKKADAERLEPFNDMLLALNNLLQRHLDTLGADNASVKGAGTVYKTISRSVSIEDGDAFRRHVIGTQQFELLDWKANGPAVDEFMKEHDGHLPPGVKYSSIAKVNVRRDNAKG